MTINERCKAILELGKPAASMQRAQANQLLILQHRDVLIDAYCKLRGWKLSKSSFCVGTLVRGRKFDNLNKPRPRTLDHEWYFRDTHYGYPIAIVGHEYCGDHEETRARLIAAAKSGGYSVTFPTDFPSWWVPNMTTLVEIRASP